MFVLKDFLLKCGVVGGECVVFVEEIYEDGDFGFEDLWVEWFCEVIDCVDVVVFEYVFIFLKVGGEENDWDVLGVFVLFDEVG